MSRQIRLTLNLQAGGRTGLVATLDVLGTSASPDAADARGSA